VEIVHVDITRVHAELRENRIDRAILLETEEIPHRRLNDDDYRFSTASTRALGFARTLGSGDLHQSIIPLSSAGSG